jgi:hypothetical protein
VGTVVYVAYSQIDLNGGCGSRGGDVGVYYRTRSEPNGSWSAARRIGLPTDSLQSFIVDGRTLHATVLDPTKARDGQVYYETLSGATYHRYLIPGAFGPTSMRVGSDGRARIAYRAAAGLRYAVFTGSGFTTSRIGGSTRRDWAPVLVLDSNDKAHVVWTRSPAPGGCVSGEPNSHDGTYYATNASGTWGSGRFTRALGSASLQLDNATGRVHVLVGGAGLRYYTRASGGAWSGIKLLASDAESPVLRLSPATGTLLAVYIRYSRSGSSAIYTLTKS